MASVRFFSLSLLIWVFTCVILLLALALAKFVPDKGQIAFWSTRNEDYAVYQMDVRTRTTIRYDHYPQQSDVMRSSPDGKLLAYQATRSENNWEIWLQSHEEMRADPINLSSHPGQDVYPVWSPDSTKLLFWSDRTGDMDIFLVDIEAVGKLRNLSHDPDWDARPTWSPDGEFIAFESTRNGQSDIFILNIETGDLNNLTNHPASDSNPAWSPDGHHLAFMSMRDGKLDIFLIDVHTGQTRNLTNNRAEDEYPIWIR